jgi:hypothetical protein
VAPFLIARAQTKMLQNLIDGEKCFSYLYVMCHFSKSTEVSKRHTFRTWLGNETFFTTGNENIVLTPVTRRDTYFASDFFGIIDHIAFSAASSISRYTYTSEQKN